ncbi:hypothetical protein Tco_0784871 [Tanacetum coccineum]
MKCAESPELRQAFADVVSAGLVKGMSEGLKHGIEHGKADRDLATVEAYDPEADSKYVTPMGLVPLITPDLTASPYPCLPSLPEGWRFCWRMPPHRLRWLTKKMNHIQDYSDPSLCYLFIIWNGNSAACCT